MSVWVVVGIVCGVAALAWVIGFCCGLEIYDDTLNDQQKTINELASKVEELRGDLTRQLNKQHDG